MYLFRSKLAVLVAVAAVTLLTHSGPFCAQALSETIASWGDNSTNQVTGTPTGTGLIDVAGGYGHSLALASDGSIHSWGSDGDGQITNTPTGTSSRTEQSRANQPKRP